MRILWFLQNALEVASMFNTEWESEFGKTFPVGSTFQIKLPQAWLVTEGLGYDPVRLDNHRAVHGRRPATVRESLSEREKTFVSEPFANGCLRYDQRDAV